MKVYKIVENRNIFFAVSIIIILAGLLSAIIFGLNLGIDFAGGTIMQINIGKPYTSQDIYDTLAKLNIKPDSIQQAGDNKEQVIIKLKSDISDELRRNIFEAFKQKYNLKDEDLLSVQKVGPSIGKELKMQALLGAAIASIGILLYVAWRFEYKLGVSAIIALIHDLLITFSVYAIFRIPINSTFVAAMLTVLGYSINDTIVIFDRIRENLKLNKKMDIAELINLSITQTMARSINTVLTVIIALVALHIFGSESIREFTLPLLVGIVSGAYSSIFIASPIWYIWVRNKKNKKGSIKTA